MTTLKNSINYSTSKLQISNEEVSSGLIYSCSFVLMKILKASCLWMLTNTRAFIIFEKVNEIVNADTNSLRNTC